MEKYYKLLSITAAGMILSCAHAEQNDGIIRTDQPGWSQWRGPARNGICDEKSLLQSWPENGPEMVREITGIGRGYSSPIFVNNTIFITGDIEDSLVIFALDMDGRINWKSENGKSWTKSFKGSRACCAYSNGRVYNMNGHGSIICLDADTGKTIWTLDMLAKFGAKSITWGHSECLLVDGRHLYISPGGSSAMAALNSMTGELIWQSDPVKDDNSGYSSPVIFQYEGIRHLVNCSSSHAFGINADTGKLLWQHERPTQYQAIASTPTYCGSGRVFVASPDGKESELFQLSRQADDVTATSLWSCHINNLSGGTIYIDGNIYGSGYRKNDGWFCVNAKSGEQKVFWKDLNTGSAVFADGRLYVLSEQGEAALLEISPEQFTVHGRYRIIDGGRKDVWAHPVIFNGLLYIRYHDKMWCYNIRKQ